ncbi:MAG TPA: class I SAM-dependent methyltransferase [Candidatus Limnocylindria bacterium]|nr:class I SAM-dependent methyltransferase [Candidatus Limnocylindria bacterium]
MAGAAGGRQRTRPGAIGLSDILAGQAVDEAVLAELYDLEHDEISEDLVFYGHWAGRQHGATIDLGCGSGRLFSALLGGGAKRIVGVDGSPALLERAATRIDADERLRTAREEGRIELAVGDVRTIRRPDRFGLAILAGVLAHLDGPEDALRALDSARRLLEPEGVLIVDMLGPGALPPHDLPLSVDWDRAVGTRRVVRRSQLTRHEAPEGMRVDYRTLTDRIEADGTIARFPASFRLWYPSPGGLIGLAEEAELVVEAAFGSHDLDPLEDESERCVIVLRRSSASASGMG